MKKKNKKLIALIAALVISLLNAAYLFFAGAGWITYQKFEMKDIREMILESSYPPSIGLIDIWTNSVNHIFIIESIFCIAVIIGLIVRLGFMEDK